MRGIKEEELKAVKGQPDEATSVAAPLLPFKMAWTWLVRYSKDTGLRAVRVSQPGGAWTKTCSLQPILIKGFHPVNLVAADYSNMARAAEALQLVLFTQRNSAGKPLHGTPQLRPLSGHHLSNGLTWYCRTSAHTGACPRHRRRMPLLHRRRTCRA